jgi:TatD DNase family protein
MKSFIRENRKRGKIVAMGEIGLDYCRLEFCDKDTQIQGFIAQLKVGRDIGSIDSVTAYSCSQPYS